MMQCQNSWQCPIGQWGECLHKEHCVEYKPVIDIVCKESLEKVIKHYEALQKRYTKTHNGKMCEITEFTLRILHGKK